MDALSNKSFMQLMKLENNIDQPMSFDDFIIYMCREGNAVTDDPEKLGVPRDVPKPSINKYDLNEMWTEKDHSELEKLKENQRMNHEKIKKLKQRLTAMHEKFDD